MTNQIPLDVVIGCDEGGGSPASTEARKSEYSEVADGIGQVWVVPYDLVNAHRFGGTADARLDNSARNAEEFVHVKILDEAKLKISNLVQHIKELEQALESSRQRREDVEQRFSAARAHYMEFSRLIRNI